jgi:hypothetical protein
LYLDNKLGDNKDTSTISAVNILLGASNGVRLGAFDDNFTHNRALYALPVYKMNKLVHSYSLLLSDPDRYNYSIAFAMLVSVYMRRMEKMAKVQRHLSIHFNSRFFKGITHEEIVDKCCDAWNDILKKDNFVNKFCSREWIELV